MKLLLKDAGWNVLKLVGACIGATVGLIIATPFIAVTWKVCKFIFLTINP